MEYEGMPVAANAPLLVTHLKSNQHVAAEDQMLRYRTPCMYSIRSSHSNTDTALCVCVYA